MQRTIARTTDVEPGHLRAFEIDEQGAEAVDHSRIPLLRMIGIGRSRRPGSPSRTWQGRSMPSTTRARTAVALWVMGSSTAPRSSAPATAAASTSPAVRSCAVRQRTRRLPRPRRQRRGPGRPITGRPPGGPPDSQGEEPPRPRVGRHRGRHPAGGAHSRRAGDLDPHAEPDGLPGADPETPAPRARVRSHSGRLCGNGCNGSGHSP